VSRCPRAFTNLAAVLVELAIAAPALADDPRSLDAASRLFEQGVEAQRRGDFQSAAQHFARADEQVADPAALEAALSASLRADDPVLAMTLVERSRRAPAPASLTRAAEGAQAKFAGRVGRIKVRCAACRATVDGLAVDVNASRWVTPGEHEVMIEIDGRADRRKLHVDAGSSTDVVPMVAPGPAAPEAPRTARARPPPSSGGLSPAWFWITLGATAAVGGGTIASGVDTAAQHAAFVKAPTGPGAEQGKAAQTRTNILTGATAGLGLLTIGIGVFAVRWRDPEPRVTAVLEVTAQGSLAALRGWF
jgi:hypothetical protein